jgi:hypothetical protein
MKSFIKTPSLALAMALAPNAVHRARTLDHQTFDTASMGTAPLDALGNQRGKGLDHAFRTHDGRTVDSTGAFLVGELERLDQTLHMPLAAVTWGRDVDLREDVSLADEFSSFTLTSFGSAGNLGAGNGGTAGKDRNGKGWIGKSTDQIGGVGVDTGKIASPLTPWGLEIKYTILELESAAKMGRPIDAQKFEALKLKHQMDIDEQVYVGDSTLVQTGLFNSALVTNVSNVVGGLWSAKTPAQILDDVNAILQSSWAASGFAVMPSRILIPPTQFGAISTQVVSTAGSVSILKYLLENNIVAASGNGKIEIQPAKWLVGAGAASADRMVAYTKRKDFVRYPMTQLQRTPIQYDSIYHKSTYFCRLGQIEVVYPETIAYRDGI